MSLIEFKLFAPRNREVILIGSFSDWQEISMSKDEQGYFHTKIDLEDGIYQYKFRVNTKSPGFDADERVDVTDPYATEVIDDAHQNGVIRIKNGQRIIDDYVWQYDSKPLPNNRELIIYEIHVGDFSGGEDDPNQRGKFKHVTEKLDYLSDLGINALELMPVNEFPGNYSWGYLVRYFFAPESSYGTSADLKELIDECHARGIRVILDGIYNHSDDQHPLLLIDRDYWYYHDQHYPDDPDNYWGPEFNYENYDENLKIKPAWEFIKEVVQFWIREYHIDGIRYDAVKQLGNHDFFRWITEKAREAAGDKPFYNIAECIPEDPDLTGVDAPFEGTWHESFRITVLEHIAGTTFDLAQLKEVLDPRHQGYLGTTNVINYLATHDRNHLMAELAERGIFDRDAFKRAKLAIGLMMTAVGVPLIWMGEEFGEYKKQTPNDPQKVDWTLLGNEFNRQLFDYYKGLIQLRRSNHALFTENIDFFHEDSSAKVMAYGRWNGEGSRVVVVVNFSDQYLTDYTIPHFPANGTWHEWTSDYDLEAGNGQLILDLPEYDIKVFVK